MVTLVNGSLLGAAPGSTWSLYPPGDNLFTPGRALAIATVTQITGKDAVATITSSAGQIPAGTRAIALLPAPTGHRIPVRILDMPAGTRKVVEETLRANITDLELVGLEEPARFSVDVERDRLRLLTADGLQVVGTFGLKEPWGAAIATVVSRSANASELLTLDNPSTLLTLDVRVATAVKPKPTVGTRGIKVVADTQAAKYRIRKQGSPRTEQNSLQLEVRVSADSYITIVDVDSEGGLNLLFPNNYQQHSFYGDGFVRANDAVLIPDSIKPKNKAGFYWDYSPPKGTDTIRVFTSTDLQTARIIRDRIASLQTSAEKTPATMRTRSVATGMHSLRQVLGTVAARGIVTVADDTSYIPGETASAPSPQTTVPTQPILPTTAVQPDIPAGLQPDTFPTTTYAASADPTIIASTAPVSDWAATSITITISE